MGVAQLEAWATASAWGFLTEDLNLDMAASEGGDLGTAVDLGVFPLGTSPDRGAR